MILNIYSRGLGMSLRRFSVEAYLQPIQAAQYKENASRSWSDSLPNIRLCTLQE